MKVILASGRLILVPGTQQEQLELAGWKEGHAGHVLQVHATSGRGAVRPGPKAEACNEPLQVISTVKDPVIRLISNFAHTPFTLDGREYASVEGFWQGLKFAKDSDRRRLAAMWGREARQAGEEQPYGATVHHEGEDIPVGAWRHWGLMERACTAKFTQHPEAREALLSTGSRPLTHRVRRDSKTIPGVIMADIWMRIRSRARNEEEESLS
jgi:predicted NAD-dependent protein-ADP-ribosyltransferase YbiA (DUF1768 family)